MESAFRDGHHGGRTTPLTLPDPPPEDWWWCFEVLCWFGPWPVEGNACLRTSGEDECCRDRLPVGFFIPSDDRLKVLFELLPLPDNAEEEEDEETLGLF